MSDRCRCLIAACLAAWSSRAMPAERGQATTEYVLILIGVGAIALFVVTWAASTGKIGELLDRVFDSLTSNLP